jgi:hypothetical protein
MGKGKSGSSQSVSEETMRDEFPYIAILFFILFGTELAQSFVKDANHQQILRRLDAIESRCGR